MFDYVPPAGGNVAPNAAIYRISHFLGIALNVAMGVGVSVSVIYIGLAGIRYIMSKGDPKAVAQARQALTYAVGALAITIGAVAFKYIVLNNILGAGGFNNATPDF